MAEPRDTNILPTDKYAIPNSFSKDTSRNEYGSDYSPTDSFRETTEFLDKTDTSAIPFSDAYSDSIPSLKLMAAYWPASRCAIVYFSPTDYTIAAYKGESKRFSHYSGAPVDTVISTTSVSADSDWHGLSIVDKNGDKFILKPANGWSESTAAYIPKSMGKQLTLDDVYIEQQFYSTRGNATTFTVNDFSGTGSNYTTAPVSYFDHKYSKDIKFLSTTTGSDSGENYIEAALDTDQTINVNRGSYSFSGKTSPSMTSVQLNMMETGGDSVRILTEEYLNTENSSWTYVFGSGTTVYTFSPSVDRFPYVGDECNGTLTRYTGVTGADQLLQSGKFEEAIALASSHDSRPTSSTQRAKIFKCVNSSDRKVRVYGVSGAGMKFGCVTTCPVLVNTAGSSTAKANGILIHFPVDCKPSQMEIEAKYSPQLLLYPGVLVQEGTEKSLTLLIHKSGSTYRYYDVVEWDWGYGDNTSTTFSLPVRVSKATLKWGTDKSGAEADSGYYFVDDLFDLSVSVDEFGIVARDDANLNASRMYGGVFINNPAKRVDGESLVLAEDIESQITVPGQRYAQRVGTGNDSSLKRNSVVKGRYELPYTIATAKRAKNLGAKSVFVDFASTISPPMKEFSLNDSSNIAKAYSIKLEDAQVTTNDGLKYYSDTDIVLHSRYYAEIKVDSGEAQYVPQGSDSDNCLQVTPYWSSMHFNDDAEPTDMSDEIVRSEFLEERYFVFAYGAFSVWAIDDDGDYYKVAEESTAGRHNVEMPKRSIGTPASFILVNKNSSDLNWGIYKNKSDVWSDAGSGLWEYADTFTKYYVPSTIRASVSAVSQFNGEYEEIKVSILQDGVLKKHQFHTYKLVFGCNGISNLDDVEFFGEDGTLFATKNSLEDGSPIYYDGRYFTARIYPKRKSTPVSAVADGFTISCSVQLCRSDNPISGKSTNATYSSVAAYDGVQITGNTGYEKFVAGSRPVPYGYGGKYTQNGQDGEATADLKWTILDPVSHDNRTLTYSTEINGGTPITTSPVNYTLHTKAGLYTNLKLKTTITADGPVTAWGGKDRVVVTREFVFGCAPEVEYVSNTENFIMKSMPTYTFDFETESWYKNGSSRTGGTGPLDFGTERNYGNYGMMDGQHTETFLSRLSATGIKNCKSVVATCYLHGPNPNSNGLPKQKIETKLEAPASNGNVTIESSWQTSRTPADDGAKYLPYYFSYELDFIRNGENRQVFASILEQDPDFANYIPLDSELSRPRVFGRTGAAHTISDANDPLPSVCTTQYPNSNCGPTLIDITYKYSNWMANGEDELTFPIGNVVGDYTGTVAKTGNAVSIGSKRDVAVSKPLVSMGTSYIATKSRFAATDYGYGWEVPERQYAGLGYLFSMVPTESSIYSNYPYYIKRGTSGELFVSASKFVPVAIKADGIDQAGKPFPTKNDWQTTNLSITADKTEDVSAVDSLTYFPKVGSVCVDTDDQIIWVNETKAGVYTVLSGDEWVPLFYGTDDTGRPLSVAKDTVYDFIMEVSGLPVGEHGISVSGVKEVVGEDGRKGTIVTTADFMDGVYVDDFGNDTGLEIHRFNNTKNIKLDYDESQILIGPNEFITSDLLNRKFDMLYHDFRQVVEFSNSYEEPPAKYVGYIGWGQEFYKENDEAGTLVPLRSQYRLWNSGEDSSKNHPLSQPQSYKNKDTIISGCNSFTIDETSASDPKFYATDYTRASDYTSASLLSDICWNRPYTKQCRYIDDEQHSEHRQIHYDDVYKEIYVPCPRVTSVKIGAGNKIFACAPQMNKILCYGKKSQQFLYDWGGFGGADSNTKFNGPVCISLNDTDEETKQFVYVLDGGNDCVKKFNNSGLWISTTKYQLKPNEHVVWMDTTLKGKIFVLAYWEESNGGKTICHGRVMVLEENVGQTAEVELRTTHKPTSIFRSNTDEFMYVTTQRDVVKLSGKGEEIGYFGDNDKVWIGIDEEFVEKIGDTIRCGYADKRGQIYLAIGPILMVYSDNFKIRSLYHKNANKFLRPKEDMHIGKQEYVQDWVFNTALQRMHDNINIIRRSIFAKVTKIPQNGAYKMRYDDISPEEYTKLQLVDKDNLYIPVNAPMSSMVINEQLKKLYDGICVLLSFAQDETEV